MAVNRLNTRTITGLLLISPFVVGVLLLIGLALGPGLNATYGGPQDIAANIGVYRVALGAATGIMIVELVGLTLLALLFETAEARPAVAVGWMLFVVTTLLWVMEMSLRMSVEAWAMPQMVGGGPEPDIWTAIHEWIHVLRGTYILTGLIATILYGVAILRSALLAHEIGWVAIGWSVLWLLIFPLMGGGIPAELLIVPLVIGAALIAGRADDDDSAATHPPAPTP